MAHYKATSTNSKDFSLTKENARIGDLKYQKWYSFNAEIVLKDNSIYQLEATGFWDSKIELKKAGKSLLEFKMGWKGIVIKSKFDGIEQNYLLKMKGMMSSKFILIDAQENELLEAISDFKWSKLNMDYTFETTTEFDNIENNELLLLTTLHCINYYMTVISAA